MRPFLAALPGRVPPPVRDLAAQVTWPTFARALVLVTVAAFAAVAWASRPRATHAARWVVALIQATVALNVLAQLALAATTGGYVPGLVTALLLNLPWSVLFFRRALREGWLSPPGPWATAGCALLVHGPGLVAIMALSRVLSQAG